MQAATRIRSESDDGKVTGGAKAKVAALLLLLQTAVATTSTAAGRKRTPAVLARKVQQAHAGAAELSELLDAVLSRVCGPFARCVECNTNYPQCAGACPECSAPDRARIDSQIDDCRARYYEAGAPDEKWGVDEPSPKVVRRHLREMRDRITWALDALADPFQPTADRFLREIMAPLDDGTEWDELWFQVTYVGDAVAARDAKALKARRREAEQREAQHRRRQEMEQNPDFLSGRATALLMNVRDDLAKMAPVIKRDATATAMVLREIVSLVEAFAAAPASPAPATSPRPPISLLSAPPRRTEEEVREDEEREERKEAQRRVRIAEYDARPADADPIDMLVRIDAAAPSRKVVLADAASWKALFDSQFSRLVAAVERLTPDNIDDCMYDAWAASYVLCHITMCGDWSVQSAIYKLRTIVEYAALGYAQVTTNGEVHECDCGFACRAGEKVCFSCRNYVRDGVSWRTEANRLLATVGVFWDEPEGEEN